MFKDCKTGGYHLEDSSACDQRLMNLILLIAIAYTWATAQGQAIKQKGVQKYVCRVRELSRSSRRHSTFWVGLYGSLWVAGMEVWNTLATQLMRLKPHKLNYFQRGLRAMDLILSTS